MEKKNPIQTEAFECGENVCMNFFLPFSDKFSWTKARTMMTLLCYAIIFELSFLRRLSLNVYSLRGFFFSICLSISCFVCTFHIENSFLAFGCHFNFYILLDIMLFIVATQKFANTLDVHKYFHQTIRV